MDISNEKQQLFERMDQEYWDYNRALERGEKATRPVYDLDLFREFRDWQQERLNRKVEEIRQLMDARLDAREKK
jgi:hypothetical protein